MKLVIDANVIIASFIRKGKAAELLINPMLEFYAPDFIMEEIFKYKEEVLSKTNRSIESLSIILSEMLSVVNIVSKKEIELYLDEALEIIKDKKDTPYIALAIKLNCPILSNDKDMKEQNRVKVYTIEEILSLLNNIK